MSKKNLTNIEEVAAPILKDLNLYYVDATLEKIAGNLTLTIFIDKDGGVNLDDCEAASKALDLAIEELDVTGGKPYHFNISSPGLDRALIKERDFVRNLNNEIEVKFFKPFSFNNKKLLIGTLIEFDETSFTLQVNEDKVKINKNLVAKASPVIKF